MRLLFGNFKTSRRFNENFNKESSSRVTNEVGELHCLLFLSQGQLCSKKLYHHLPCLEGGGEGDGGGSC